MQPALPDPLVARLSDFLAQQIGLHFPKERWSDLARRIAAAAPAFGAPDAESCVQRLLSAPLTRNQIEILASHLTVGETYFLREKKSFEILEERIFPELLRARAGAERRLRVWSAGCCTGEEPYSLAILLDRLIPDFERWNVTILATDINPEFLRKAADGLYSEWSFRDTPAWLRERYFKKRKNGRFEIDPHIRKRVTPSYLNLAEDIYPSLSNNTNAMDVIFCRNVLMYFTAARARKVVDNLYQCLVDGGWLVVSPTETSNLLFSRFATVEFPGAVLYRKSAGAEPQFAARDAAPAFTPLPEVLPPFEPILSPQPPVWDAAGPGPPKAVRQETEATPLPEPQPEESERERLCRRARTCANRGRLAEAAEWCEKAIAADKLDPAAHYLLAVVEQERGQSAVAVRSLTRALYLDPDFALAHFALGNIRLSQGRQRDAGRHFETASVLLKAHPREEPLPESEGLTAGRLGEIIASVRACLPRTAAA